MIIQRAIITALLLAAPLCAQAFDASGFFGPAFTPDPGTAARGTLTLALNAAPPEWVGFSGSGAGRARACFEFGKEGMSIRPNSVHGTCEALIDIGVSDATASISIVELEKGGTFAWHLRDLADAERAWLVELSREHTGEWLLRMRARKGGRYVAINDARHEIAKLDLPAEFKLTINADTLSAEIGAAKCKAAVNIENGVSIGLAATDERALLAALRLDVSLHAMWVQDASARLTARRTLERLREHATTGLLSGIVEFGHPALKQTLEGYTDAERRDRDKAAGAADRAEVLARIARNHTGSAAAQHEAGLALLLAGQAAAALERLVAADKLSRVPVTSLALAEACRRVGDLDAAMRALEQARTELPEALQAGCALIEGRLLADRGDIAGASRVLIAARDRHQGQLELEAFADSAQVLLQPPTLQSSTIKAPLGLTMISDLPEEVLAPLLAQLEPYLERIRHWLPDLGKNLDGVVAIFNSPVEYLRAALLVAGENLDNVAGMYLAAGIGGKPTVMACRAFGEDELIRTLVHELWHLALASSGRATQVPRWLNEGMAVFLSAGVVERGSMDYNQLPSEFDAFGDAPLALFSVERLKTALAARPAEFYAVGHVQGNYLAGWAIVWFHAQGKEGGATLRAMLKGDAAAYAGLATDVAGLHRDVKQDLEKRIR